MRTKANFHIEMNVEKKNKCNEQESSKKKNAEQQQQQQQQKYTIKIKGKAKRHTTRITMNDNNVQIHKL